ncbi:MAG: 6-phosphogluconolactonase [Pacificimonas sp.]
MDRDELEIWEAEAEDEFYSSLAGDIGFIIDSALDARREALIVLPADEFLLPAYEKIAEQKRDWRHVAIVPSHDGLVAVDDPESKAAWLARLFMPKGARVLPLSSTNDDYKMAGVAADARLQDLGWPLDLVLLMLGAEGSVAGLVPGPDLEEAMADDLPARAIGVADDEGDVQVTISKLSIVKARTLIFALSGEGERDELEAAADGGGDTTVAKILADVTVPIDAHCLMA